MDWFSTLIYVKVDATVSTRVITIPSNGCIFRSRIRNRVIVIACTQHAAQYPLKRMVDVVVAAGGGVLFEQKVARISYGEIGHYGPGRERTSIILNLNGCSNA